MVWVRMAPVAEQSQKVRRVELYAMVSGVNQIGAGNSQLDCELKKESGIEEGRLFDRAIDEKRRFVV